MQCRSIPTKTQLQIQIHPNHRRQNIIGSTEAIDVKIQNTLIKTQSTIIYFTLSFHTFTEKFQKPVEQTEE